MYYDNDSEEKLKGTIDIRAAKYEFKDSRSLDFMNISCFTHKSVWFASLQGDRG